jgi:hypothetical protein
MIESEEWRLEMDIRFVFKGKGETVGCKKCGGRGEIGGGFKSFEPPERCWLCNGTGRRPLEPKTDSPLIPMELVEHMNKAWQEFFKTRSYRATEPS